MKAFTETEAKAVSDIRNVMEKCIGEQDITVETVAEAVCSDNSHLEYIEVLEDIRKMDSGGKRFKNSFYKLPKDRSLSFTQQLEQEFPDDMSESEQKGFFSAMYTFLSEKEETPEEVVARTDMTLEEQKEILDECCNSQVDNIVERFSEQLRESWIFQEGMESFAGEYNQESAEDELSKRKENSELLDSATVYAAAQSGVVSEEWKNPELLGIMFAARDTFVSESINSEQLEDERELWEEGREAFIRGLLKIIVITILLVIAAVLLTKGMYAFADVMIAEETLLTGAELVAHIVVGMLGTVVLLFAAVASTEAAIGAGIYLIYQIVSRVANFIRSRRKEETTVKESNVIETSSFYEEPDDEELDDDEMDEDTYNPVFA